MTTDDWLDLIVASPEDADLRRVFSDWLQENGKPEWGTVTAAGSADEVISAVAVSRMPITVVKGRRKKIDLGWAPLPVTDKPLLYFKRMRKPYTAKTTVQPDRNVSIRCSAGVLHNGKNATLTSSGPVYLLVGDKLTVDTGNWCDWLGIKQLNDFGMWFLPDCLCRVQVTVEFTAADKPHWWLGEQP